MKKFHITYIIALLVSVVSCQSKQSADKLDGMNFNLSDSTHYDESGSLAVNPDRMTQALYDSLQLAEISDLQGYEPGDLSMGRVLLENEYGKIITIHIITEGEITEYLLSYDANNQLTDNLLVAYEDMVEYYSAVSSKINDNKIVVQTINYTYGGSDGNSKETSDTSFVNYQITNELKFIKQ